MYCKVSFPKQVERHAKGPFRVLSSKYWRVFIATRKGKAHAEKEKDPEKGNIFFYSTTEKKTILGKMRTMLAAWYFVKSEKSRVKGDIVEKRKRKV